MSTIQRVLAGNITGMIGAAVRTCGFVETVRDQKHRQFIVLRDGSGTVQLIHEKNPEQAKLAAEIAALRVGSAIEVSGTVVASPQVKLGGVEVVIDTLTVHGPAFEQLPVTHDSSLELRMDYRHVSLRFPESQLIMRVQTTMEWAMRQYWHNLGFVEIHSPKLMGTASESGAELFSLPYFGNRTAYLAQSPQFYKQMAMVGGIERVFEIGPVFRANPSFTSRHDTEFTSVDVEIAWVTSHEDVMSLEEHWLVSVLQAIKEAHGDEIERVFGAEVVIPELPFPRVTLERAREILAGRGHMIAHKADLDPAGERLLAQYIAKEYGHEFVFVTDYPVSVRAFYHMRQENDPETTKSFDLLWKGVEVTTGAQREHRLAQLRAQAIEKGITPESLADYLGFFHHGCPPHGGFGAGLTRLLMLLLNRDNVREVTYVYRGPNRLRP
ncbi:MAG: aspartate--tRNA(Asn) ligase [Candidatus Moranbacteria bacterium]|nr:aspartate--tRNA(Asn) ligase [Candidatus Moranbacteria bacterium]